MIHQRQWSTNVGSIQNHQRSITKDEVECLTSGEFLGMKNKVSSDVCVLEFNIYLDSITRFQVDGLRDATQLHVLRVNHVELGFETCFMDHSIASGSFPSEILRVAFAVRPVAGSNENWIDATGANWAIAFHWHGDAIEIIDGDMKDVTGYNDILPIYRLWAIQQAKRQLRASDI